MKISSKAHYGLQAAYVLAENAGESFSASELGKKIGVSAKYLERIMRALCSVGAVKATRGINGGYCLNGSPESVSVGVIVRALEDDLEIIGCVKGGACQKCASSAVWKKLYRGINDLLDGISLADMVAGKNAAHLQEFGEKAAAARGEKPIEKDGRSRSACTACSSCSSCSANCEKTKKTK